MSNLSSNINILVEGQLGKADPISDEALQKFHIVMSGFWMTICTIGIGTNFINLRTFVRMGLEDSVNITFFALAISDFDICSIAFVEMLTFVCAVVEKELSLWFYLPPLISTFLLMCIRRIFNTTTILITTFLALQRCLCVALPFRVRGMFTRFRSCVYLTTIFICSIICYSLYIWRHRVVPVLNEAWNATQLRIYVPPGSEPYLFLMEVVLGIGLNMACQILILVSLIVMGILLNKTLKFRQSAAPTTVVSSSETSSKIQHGRTAERTGAKEMQAIKQVALVSTIFIATNSPYLVFGIANILIPEFGINQQFNNLYHLVHNMMFTAELINSTVNFVVYYKYNSKFRKCCFRSSEKQVI